MLFGHFVWCEEGRSSWRLGRSLFGSITWALLWLLMLGYPSLLEITYYWRHSWLIHRFVCVGLSCRMRFNDVALPFLSFNCIEVRELANSNKNIGLGLCWKWTAIKWLICHWEENTRRMVIHQTTSIYLSLGWTSLSAVPRSFKAVKANFV